MLLTRTNDNRYRLQIDGPLTRTDLVLLRQMIDSQLQTNRKAKTVTTGRMLTQDEVRRYPEIRR